MFSKICFCGIPTINATARKRTDRHACGFDPTCRLSLLVLQDMDPPKLGRAAEIYEQLGRSCMEKKLLAMNAKGYWLQTGLCLLGELRM